ncbi:molybdenum cofactor guanylyltransferase [Parasphingorhabdus sp.]|uniref:molybdenum cofactor guanylyltransferase n=1 Tax=Parasphingorhabdus sp. TaxID=2709688 RepID=UPI003A901E46
MLENERILLKHSNIPIVIAAGGKGCRIGGGKPFLILDGISLIDRSLDRVSRWSSDVAVALQEAPSQTLRADIELLVDHEKNQGPLSALSNALCYAQKKKSSHVLLIPCDMPFLPDDLLQRLEQEIGASQVAMARSNGQIHPICALWSTNITNQITAYAETGRRSLIGLADTMQVEFIDWTGADPDPFFNINTPEDMKQAQSYFC